MNSSYQNIKPQKLYLQKIQIKLIIYLQIQRIISSIRKNLLKNLYTLFKQKRKKIFNKAIFMKRKIKKQALIVLVHFQIKLIN